MTIGPPSPWAFERIPKIPGTGRTVPIEDTQRRTAPLLRRVPITRIADLTPLDTIGLPVYSACTPLASDLTLHMGKGVDARSARMSAIMEAIERASGEVAPANTVRASYRELLDRSSVVPVAPDAFDLPSDTSYGPERPFDWMEGYDLLKHERVLVPVDLMITPPREGLLVDVDTNGLASGNIHLEAVVHGLCEIVERDCVSEIEFTTLFGDSHDARPSERRIDLGTLPGPAREWIDRGTSGGLEFVVHDITNDLNVPTYRTYVVDHFFPVASGDVRTMAFYGMGTHPASSVAVLRSITEAIQARLGHIQGARDSFNIGRSRPRRTTHLQRLRRLGHAHRTPFVDVAASTDLRDDLDFLLAALAGAGIERCIVGDLTRPDLGIPVVRTRVPGLSAFCLNMRRVGPRCSRWLL